MTTLEPPSRLADNHDLSVFNSGTLSRDDWLRRRARANQANDASRTFVVCNPEPVVVGYYALASGGVAVSAASGRFRRNMPDPVPVMVLGRLAVHRGQQGRGLGRALFRDAALRVLGAAHEVGIRGIVVHAISAEARNFYLALGFSESPLDPMTLMMTLADIRANL